MFKIRAKMAAGVLIIQSGVLHTIQQDYRIRSDIDGIRHTPLYS